jgi:hypothetical protein
LEAVRLWFTALAAVSFIFALFYGGALMPARKYNPRVNLWFLIAALLFGAASWVMA